MANEILAVPEEKLEEVINIIRLGIKEYNDSSYFKSPYPQETIEMLERWCEEELEYVVGTK